LRTVGNIVCAEDAGAGVEMLHGNNNSKTLAIEEEQEQAAHPVKQGGSGAKKGKGKKGKKKTGGGGGGGPPPPQETTSAAQIAAPPLPQSHTSSSSCKNNSSSSNYSSGPITDFTQHVIKSGCIKPLRRLIRHPNREIQKEACWTLSNISAGTHSQIQAVLDSGCIAPLVDLALGEVGGGGGGGSGESARGVDKEVQSEACWVILNATSCGNESQIRTLIDAGCIRILGKVSERVSEQARGKQR